MLSYDRVLGILERQISAQERSLNFVIIVTARKSGCVSILGVLPNREKDTVIKFNHSRMEWLKKTIKTVCSDMYKGYTEAIREELSHVHLVIDRFHVTRAYCDGLDTLPKSELKRLKKESSAQEYKLLKGSIWALRKERQDFAWDRQKH